MRYFVALIIVFGILFFGFFKDFPFSVNISLGVCMVIILLLWEYEILKQNFKGNFQMKSQRKNIDISNVIFGMLWTIMFIVDSESVSLITCFLFWGIVLVDIIIFFVYKMKKPTTIFIDGDILIFNSRWIKQRDLRNLNYIGITNANNYLELGFIKKSDVRIPVKEYDKKDFRRFLDILVEKSEHNVYLIDKINEKYPALTSKF